MSEKTILLVEDDEIQREGAALALRQGGYAVLVTADAREALSLVKGGAAPHLIVIDMMIPSPRADGWYFLKVRRRHAPLSRVPVIVMTGLVSASEEWAASLGASRLLRKPVEMEALLECVRRCLGECQEDARS